LEALSGDVAVLGIKAFVQILKLENLEDLTAKMSSKVLTSKTKVVMSKRLMEAMKRDGITKYLTSLKPSEKQLKSILERLGVEPTSKKTTEMIEQVQTEIHYLGLSTLFDGCTAKQLQACATDLGLKVESSAKTVLLRCILHQTDYKAEDKPKIVRKPRAPKKEVDGDSEMADGEEMAPPEPRKPPPKFDWVASEDDDEDFDENAPAVEDVEMSDVASEHSDDGAEESEEEDEENDGEYREQTPRKKEKVVEEEEADDAPEDDEDDE